MDEPLTEVERRALEWLRDEEYARVAGLDHAVRAGLIGRGLAEMVHTRLRGREHVAYTITARGRAALDAPRSAAPDASRRPGERRHPGAAGAGGRPRRRS